MARIPLLPQPARHPEGSLMLHRNPPQHHRHCACDPDTVDAEMKADLCQMVHEDRPERLSLLADEFIETHRARIQRVLTTVAHNAHLPYDMKDDILSYFGEALMFMVSVQWRKAPAQFDTMSAPAYILEMRTREVLRKERLHGLSEGGSQYSGPPGYRRKMELVAKSRERFVQQHRRVPSATELCAFHNELMRASRSDPRKQGVLVTPAELFSGEPISINDDSSPVHEIAVTDTYDESEIDRISRIESIFEKCDEMDDADLARIARQPRKPKTPPIARGAVARAFFAMHRIGQYPTRSEVAESLGVTDKNEVREVNRRLREVMAMAREVFADMRVTNGTTPRDELSPTQRP